jgi:hypothetical protein
MIQLQCHSAVLKKGNACQHIVVLKCVVGSVIEYLKYGGTEDISLFSVEIKSHHSKQEDVH